MSPPRIEIEDIKFDDDEHVDELPEHPLVYDDEDEDALYPPSIEDFED